MTEQQGNLDLTPYYRSISRCILRGYLHTSPSVEMGSLGRAFLAPILVRIEWVQDSDAPKHGSDEAVKRTLKLLWESPSVGNNSISVVEFARAVETELLDSNSRLVNESFYGRLSDKECLGELARLLEESNIALRDFHSILTVWLKARGRTLGILTEDAGRIRLHHEETRDEAPTTGGHSQ